MAPHGHDPHPLLHHLSLKTSWSLCRPAPLPRGLSSVLRGVRQTLSINKKKTVTGKTHEPASSHHMWASLSLSLKPKPASLIKTTQSPRPPRFQKVDQLEKWVSQAGRHSNTPSVWEHEVGLRVRRPGAGSHVGLTFPFQEKQKCALEISQVLETVPVPFSLSLFPGPKQLCPWHLKFHPPPPKKMIKLPGTLLFPLWESDRFCCFFKSFSIFIIFFLDLQQL